MEVKIRFGDRLRSQRKSAQHCLIATAARRSWGGEWTVNHRHAEHVGPSGRVTRWRPSATAHLVMTLFDHGIPLPVRTVRLVRGKSFRRRSPAVRKARRAGVSAGAFAVLALVVNGLEWVIYGAAGLAVAVLVAVASVRLRRARRAARPAVQSQDRGVPERVVRPPVPEPVPHPVRDPAPKAPAVIREPATSLPAANRR